MDTTIDSQRHDDDHLITDNGAEIKETQAVQFSDPFIDHVLFTQASHLNINPEYWFKLRGHNNGNLFVDCATPLVGLILRARTQQTPPNNVSDLYKQCVDEIKAIEIELSEAGHDYATIIAYRYILCTFIDEAIMSTEWGSSSVWVSKSLLVHFHDEAWGGEKIYLIIERLEQDFSRYFHLLEFVFLCLCLGFQGRFKVMASHEQKNYDSIVLGLYEKLRRHSGWEPEPFLNPYKEIVSSQYQMRKEITPRTVLVWIVVIALVIYLFYFFQLDGKSDLVIDDLRQILAL